ncbi:hypothetical protein LXO72_10045 [Streptococcus sp. XMC]|mgnify:FL=1|jgi:predicted DNA-binding protein YlxM (UPF0122 family)|uniref:hypothetical protein n=1 Tax=Streptococcus sp. XMC TaxID=2905972 RepID=UPI001E331AED|nr:hypothetical protein [Streptococcus sp. XMC]MCE3592697.1 hypothetical protein [Streptococcus sp. XMC]
MDKYELHETDRKIALHENLVKEQEEIISKYEERLKVASKDEHFGIKSAISNHKAMLQSFKFDLEMWRDAKKDGIFPGWD